MGGKKIDELKEGVGGLEQRNIDLSETLSSRLVITSSVYGQPLDGEPGQGGPFVNSLIRVLIKNVDPKISVSELIQQTGKDMVATYPNFQMTPGLGVLRNSKHHGGEFKFKLKEEFVELSKDSGKSATELLEKSIRESMKKLEKEFITKLESNQKMYEERIKNADKNEPTNKKHPDVKELRGLLINDEIEEFFDEIDLIQDSIDDEILTPLAILGSRWNAINNQSLLGVMNKQDEIIEKNKIRKGLIEITTKLKFKVKKENSSDR